jgi:hypothetical protein
VFPNDDGKDYPKLLQAAQKGNQQAYETVAVHLNQHPEIWDRIGDIAHLAQLAWVDTAAQGNLVSAEGIRQRLRTLQAELSGSDPSPLEQLLIERVVLCWLQVHYLEQRYAALLQASDTSQRDDYYQNRVDRAHQRYLTAIRTLAVVRRLLAPSIRVAQVAQLNVSYKAVNLVGTSPVADSSADSQTSSALGRAEDP